MLFSVVTSLGDHFLGAYVLCPLGGLDWNCGFGEGANVMPPLESFAIYESVHHQPSRVGGRFREALP